MSKLIIKNVPNHIGTYSIKDLCQKYGKVDRCQRMVDGTLKIKMLYPKDAKKVYEEVNGMSLLGNVLEVSLQ